MDDQLSEVEMTMAFPVETDETTVQESKGAILQLIAGNEVISFPLERMEMIIGRSALADITVCDPYLSANHARILMTLNFYYIEDLGSINGTWVNGKSVSFNRIAHQDEIRLGQSHFRFVQLNLTGH